MPVSRKTSAWIGYDNQNFYDVCGWAPVGMGTAGTLSNTQCTINSAASSVSNLSGTDNVEPGGDTRFQFQRDEEGKDACGGEQRVQRQHHYLGQQSDVEPNGGELCRRLRTAIHMQLFAC